MKLATFGSMRLPFFLILLPFVSAWSGTESFPTDSLRKNIETIFQKGGLGGRWGLEVYSNSRQAEILGVRADEAFMPASTGKLYVTAAALDLLPNNFRFRTRLEISGYKTGRTLNGRIRIIGGGDPGLSERFYPPNQPLLGWADSLKNWGIDSIQGEVVADEGFLQDRHPTVWKSSFFNDWYGAEPSALSWQDNLAWMSIGPDDERGSPCRISFSPDVGQFQVKNQCLTAKSGGHSEKLLRDETTNQMTVSGNLGQNAGVLRFRVPVRNPAEYLRLSFIKLLGQRGVSLIPEEKPMGVQLPVLKNIDFYGITLEQAVLVTNSRSHNLYAELLLRQLSQYKYKSGNVANGLRVVQDFLRKQKIPLDAYQMVDGSGLSYQNRISPRLTARLLSSMLHHPRFEVFYKSLAAPGFGTGGRRMWNLKYPEVTRFKTGFVDGTQGLSGYILSSDGDTLSVSLHLNGYAGGEQQARAVLDKAWITIAEYVNGERLAVKDMKNVWKNNQVPQSWDQRLKNISSAWLGRPFVPRALGDGIWSPIDRKPLAKTSAFDDRSYVETVLATAYAPTQDMVDDVLMQVRYFGGKTDFQDRRHYFYPDLFQANPWLKSYDFAGSVRNERTLNRQKTFALVGLRYPGSNPKVALRYLPMNRALELFSTPWNEPGRILGLGTVPKLDDQWSSNLGFLILEKGQKPVFRHAALSQAKVLDEPLADWLKSHQDDLDGLFFWEMRSPL